jgi:hypothetical protein
MNKTNPPVKPTPATVSRGGRSQAVPTEHDLAEAKEDALLQLRIGRTAHFYTMIVFSAMFVDGFLVILLNPSASGAPLLRALFFLFFPLAGALLIAGFGIGVKWDTYQIWPWELHFWVTVVSVALAVLLTFLLIARLFTFGPTGNWTLLPWLLPLTLLAIALPIIGLSLTWQDWTPRKIGSIIAAALPLPMSLLLYLPSTSGSSSALTLTLIASGGLFLLSGSLLHLISSATQTSEREVMVSGQSRLFQFAEDLRQREDALRFREGTLIRREADVEVAEAASARKLLAVEDVQDRLKKLEEDLEQRANKVHADFQQSSIKLSEVSQIQRELGDRESQLMLREQAVERWETQRQERERALAEAEGELVRQKLEHGSREKEMLSREQTLATRESQFDLRAKEVDRRSKELLGRERPVGAPGAPGSAPSPSAREEELRDRETRLEQVQLTINEQSALLGRKAKEVDERLAEARRLADEQARREQALVARERALLQREPDVAQKLENAAQRQRQYDEALSRVESRARELEKQRMELTSKLDEMIQRGTAFRARETALREQQEELRIAREELEQHQRGFIARQKELESREHEYALRRQSSELTPTSAPPPAARLAFPAPTAPVATATPSTRSVTARPGRIATGVPRFDELLLGGVPEKGQVLLVGPPFIGKEVALYAYLAEGLRQGDSVILVTTSRSPPELAAEIGVLAPQFREYEQMGRVHWIDASNPTATPMMTSNGGGLRAVVRGPADFTGILAALAAAVKPVPGPGRPTTFRVGVLHLSACMAQGDPKATFGFISNFIGILKPRSASAMYAIDVASLDDTQLQSALGRMDGALRFKEERGKTFVTVQGLGEVATRDWVEYRATNRSISLGSFSLERIR